MWEGSCIYRNEGIRWLIFVAMGKDITDQEPVKESWDSNAITPGTPFMDLLAASLRYWVVQKMNTDPGWKGVRISTDILSSVLTVCED